MIRSGLARCLLAGAAIAGAGAGDAAWAQARVPEGRWRAEERCEGDSTSRSFVLSSDGTMLTARLPGANVNSFGAIVGFAPLLPGGRFSIDIAMGAADSKSSYTGRVRDDRTITTDGGAWSGSNFRPCRLAVSWLGPLPAQRDPQPAAGGRTTAGRPEPATGPTSAGRPEPIPQPAPRSPAAGAAAGRPEPVPAAPRDRPAPTSALPPCEDAGPAPNALGADGVWRPICVPRGAAATARTPPVPPPPAAAAPARPPAAGGTSNEADQLRRQLEEERARREAAERALRLNEALGRQGRN
jgi:hypothetical protein